MMRVLVVDDSALVRQTFSTLFRDSFAIDTAADPLIAGRKIEKQRPDVVVLDLQMPRMDGLSFLRQIMRSDPLPVVICSSAAARGSEMAMRALEEGAVDLISKPAVGVRDFIADQAVIIADALRGAAQARVRRVRPTLPVTQRHSADAILPLARKAVSAHTAKLIAIGASTGGTEALRVIIERLPPNAPPVVVVQHMPQGFTGAFAKRLDSLAQVEVREAVGGDAVIPGRVLIAPGGRHLLIRRSGGGYVTQIEDGPLVSRHRPSVDVLFRSVAQAAGRNAAGVILTGMGDDGAAGLAEMRAAGATTIAQDEATSVVFGMPKEAIARGAAESVVPLHHIAQALLTFGGVQ